jgi:hypothetical protein
MKNYQIRKEGNYIIVKALVGDKYVPYLMFESLRPFHKWALEIGESCKDMADLAEEIENVYRGTFSEPKGEVVSFINTLETIDGIK